VRTCGRDLSPRTPLQANGVQVARLGLRPHERLHSLAFKLLQQLPAEWRQCALVPPVQPSILRRPCSPSDCPALSVGPICFRALSPAALAVSFFEPPSTPASSADSVTPRPSAMFARLLPKCSCLLRFAPSPSAGNPQQGWDGISGMIPRLCEAAVASAGRTKTLRRQDRRRNRSTSYRIPADGLFW
jgi:hypothetical protein